MADYLDRVLKQQNIIIISRPHKPNILDCMSLDLELKNIEFSPNRVDEFL